MPLFGAWLDSQGWPFGMAIATAITVIEIVGTPNKEVETKYERDRQTMEITKSTATQKTAPASSPANAAP